MATIFKNILIVPLKPTIYYIYESKFHSLPPVVFYCGSSEKHRIKPVSAFLPASPVGEQTGNEKLAGVLLPWQSLVKL
jgi:hypothetical protein